MNLQEIIQNQFYTSLEMLKQAIVSCPDALWEEKSYQNRFWHIAYHALFFTHLYLQPTESDFIPWEKHRENQQYFGNANERPHPNAPAYTKSEILDYLVICQQQVTQQLPLLNLEGESGFSWISFSKMELQLYNIRHIQLHTGELCERLGAHGKIEIRWVGKKPDYLN